MARHALSGAAAIVGLGITPQGKVYGNTALGFAVDAVHLALEDAGLERTDLDGLILNPGLSWNDLGMGSFQLQQAMGLRDLRLSATMGLGGATAAATIQHATQAIAAGLCTTVACVFSDAPLKPPTPTRERAGSASAYGFARGWEAAYGYFGVNAMYALVARRHMIRFGTTQDHLGAVAVAQRRWSNLNPAAQLHDQPLTLADYHRSRWVVEPFHLFDCCLVSNGGLAVVVTARDHARDRPKPPVWVRGMAQGHLGGDPMDTLASGAVLTRGPAFAMAGLGLGDVDVVELYDCYTFTVVVTLEDYGFCAKGEGGPFVAEQVTGPGGRLAVNTGGGQLSSFYMWGMTPISEAVIQLRGEGGRRQAAKHDVALVSGNGGVLSTHSTLILAREAT
jgi:acetyl-CoA acetyltransferase